ncbi:ABC transporter permease [Nonomuraea candida]|uniref:ABC transporter permease n=1 Tax=Nonomuraea candida TaxID=359159 RepID=UPI00069438E8|nr:ABC transporter permease [Nonomuraea candida]
MIDLVASEWLKLRSLRATYYVLAATLSAVVLTGFAAYSISRYFDTHGPGGDAVGTGLGLSADLPPVLFGMLGVFAISGEYTTGMIRLTLTTIRSRWTLLLAKAAVVAAMAAVAGQALAFATYFTAQAVVAGRPIGASFAEHTALTEVLTSGAGAAVAGVLGLGLATVLRSTPGALIALVVLPLAPTVLERFLPAPWNDWVSSLTIPSLTRQLAAVPDAGAFGPATAATVLVGYVVLSLLPATVAINHRDA